MTLRFASARTISLPTHLTRASLGRLTVRAANDNGDAARHDEVLRLALRHFAEQGLRAAEDAGERARRAHLAGDKAGYRHWIAICRALDRRRAAAIGASLARLPR